MFSTSLKVLSLLLQASLFPLLLRHTRRRRLAGYGRRRRTELTRRFGAARPPFAVSLSSFRSLARLVKGLRNFNHSLGSVVGYHASLTH